MPAFSAVLQLSGELNLTWEHLTSFWSWFSLKGTRFLLVKEQSEETGPQLRAQEIWHRTEEEEDLQAGEWGWRQLNTGGGHSGHQEGEEGGWKNTRDGTKKTEPESKLN